MDITATSAQGIRQRGDSPLLPVYRQRFEHMVDLAITLTGGDAASLSLVQKDGPPSLLAFSGFEKIPTEGLTALIEGIAASDHFILDADETRKRGLHRAAEALLPGGKLLMAMRFDVRENGTGILCVLKAGDKASENGAMPVVALEKLSKIAIDLMSDYLREASGESPLGASMRGVSVPNLRLPSGHIETEEGLRELIQLFQLILDNIPQAVFWKDRKSVYLGCNYNFAFDAGVGVAGNIVGKTDYDLAWQEEQAAAFIRDDREVMDSGRPIYHIIEPQDQADGKIAWLETNKIPLYDTEGKVVGLLGTYEDITERKQSEEELRRAREELEIRVIERTQELSEANLKLMQEIRERRRVEEALLLSRERYALAVNAGQVGVWEWNVQTDALYLDPSLKAILGIEPARKDIRFGDWMLAVHHEDRAAVRREMRSFWAGKLPLYEQEYRIARAGGQPRWVLARGSYISDESGRIRRMTGSVTDITALKDAEQALQRRDAILEALTRSSQHLLAPGDLEPGLYDALSLLGGAVGFDRAYLLSINGTRDGDIEAIATSAWSAAEGDDAYRDSTIPPFRFRACGLADWIERFLGGESIYGTGSAFAEKEQAFLADRGIGSLIWVPVFSNGRWWGILGFDTKDQAHKSLPAEIDALRSAASALGLAFMQQQIRQAEREQMTLADALRDTAGLLNSTLNLSEVLDRILSEIGRVVPHDSATIILIEGKQAKIVRSRDREGGRTDLEEAALAFTLDSLPHLTYMIQSKGPLIIEDTRGNPRWQEAAAMGDAVLSYIGTPILIEGAVIGFIGLNSATPGFFGPVHAERLSAFANQAAAAIRNAQLYQQAQELAAVEERQRLARDLHDAVSQTLWTASIIADVLPTIWEKNQAQGRDSLEKMRRLTRGALAEMRTLLLELRPAALMESSLVDLLRQLAATTMSRKKLDITLNESGSFDLPPEVRLGIYRIAQETLNNIAKHSRASHVEIRLNGDDRTLQMRIHDDGCGFNIEDLPADRLGMTIMRERAQSIGADLIVSSTIGQGTEVMITWKEARYSNHAN